MNRIILIGNGFDLAHGLPTGYTDFINHYWSDFGYKVFGEYERWMAENYGTCSIKPYSDNFASFEITDRKNAGIKELPVCCNEQNSYNQLCEFINDYNKADRFAGAIQLKFKNSFFEHISNQCSLKNWVDIENEYYNELKKLLKEEDSIKRSEKCKKLNEDFEALKKCFESYLSDKVKDTEIEHSKSITPAFVSKINFKDIAIRKQNEFVKGLENRVKKIEEEKNKDHFTYLNTPKTNVGTSWDESIIELNKRSSLLASIDDEELKNHLIPSNTLIFNFNYTNTLQMLYWDQIHRPVHTMRSEYEIINIHGELENNNNPIIFGYGDELDDDYKAIEKLQDNGFMKNIKSSHYLTTTNYRKLLSFIQFEPYQVFTMGHSCGNSDRTLLNTIFEHPNCFSIKPFYHQCKEGEVIKDDYLDIIMNISRNFNNKQNLRDIVVNKEYCEPLIPIDL